jgi:hypothetical protein
MKQQTAVEWLYNNLKSHFEHDGDLLEVVQFSFEQAKEMEKEQIIHAYGQGAADEAGEILDATKDSEEYYNKKYGGNK